VERAIVTVKNRLSGIEAVSDLEIPADLPAERLVELLPGALGVTGRPIDGRLVTRIVLRLVRPGEPELELRPDQSLADVNAWNGSVLELVGVRDELVPPRVAPVVDWRPLLDHLAEVDDLAALVVDDQEPVRANNHGYVPKRVD
jgi:hypothetical protein